MEFCIIMLNKYQYYDKSKTYITTVNRKAQYLLKASPVKFKKEFKMKGNDERWT